MNSLELHPLLKKDQNYFNRFDESQFIKDDSTLNGHKIFKFSHDDIVKEWKNSDYQLKIIQGICNSCCELMMTMHRPVEIVAQKGCARFGVQIGLCLPCIYEAYTDFQKYRTQLKVSIPFEGSSDIHEVNMTVPLLQDLLNRTIPSNSLKQEEITETENLLTEDQESAIRKILETAAPIVLKSNEEQKRKFSCKKCHLIIDGNLDLVNKLRKEKKIAGMCLGCGIPSLLNRGCSMLTCECCVSNTKTCVVCMEGAADFPHDLRECSQKMFDLLKNPLENLPLPSLKECECVINSSSIFNSCDSTSEDN